MSSPSERLLEATELGLFETYQTLMEPYASDLLQISDLPTGQSGFDKTVAPYVKTDDENERDKRLLNLANILVDGFEEHVVPSLQDPSHTSEMAQAREDGLRVYTVLPHVDFKDPAIAAGAARFASRRSDHPFDGSKQAIFINKAVSALLLNPGLAKALGYAEGATAIDVVAEFATVFMSHPSSQAMQKSGIPGTVRSAYNGALMDQFSKWMGSEVYLSPSGETDKKYQIGRQTVQVMHAISENTLAMLTAPDVRIKPIYLDITAHPARIRVFPLVQCISSRDIRSVMGNLGDTHRDLTGIRTVYMRDYDFLQRAKRVFAE